MNISKGAILGEAVVRTAIAVIFFVAGSYTLHLDNTNLFIGFSIGSFIANITSVYQKQKEINKVRGERTLI